MTPFIAVSLLWREQHMTNYEMIEETDDRHIINLQRGLGKL
jgi:hypothetical protein